MRSAPERPYAQVFWMPKAGSTPAEYEDAYTWSDSGRFPFRAAVADGATESAFARAWAQRLAEGGVEAGIDGFQDGLGGWQQEWKDSAEARAAGLPWYAAAKAEQGAFATLLLLELHESGTWSALAVGDCCLFHLHEGRLLRAWPIEAPDQFSNHPALIGSHPRREAAVSERQAGTWEPGDRFLLASDALAAWLMQAEDPGAALHPPDTLADRLDAARTAGTLRNDDVTLVTVYC